MRPADDIEAEQESERHLEKIATAGKAGADIATAIRVARAACEEAGLNAEFSDRGVAEFSPWQTAKAVRHAREDAAAILIIQLSVLKRLDRLFLLTWVALVMLGYLILR